MNDPRNARSDQQLQFLRELLAENASIDADILEIREDIWAIHSVFPYDGEVPMAMFGTYDEAAQVLGEVRGITPLDEP